jgi:hypothetical protein
MPDLIAGSTLASMRLLRAQHMELLYRMYPKAVAVAPSRRRNVT